MSEKERKIQSVWPERQIRGVSVDTIPESILYVQATVPMQRWGQADEVAKAVLFLASDNSSYMTGGDLMVDGGLGQL